MSVAQRVCRRLKNDESNRPFQSGMTENEDADKDEDESPNELGFVTWIVSNSQLPARSTAR